MREKHFNDSIDQEAELNKITYEEYQRKLLDERLADNEILKYSRIVKGEGAFDWNLVADPDKVTISEEEQQIESTMKIGSTLDRWRRARRFGARLHGGDQSPVLVSEGDSWFQFPFLIREVIDQLEDDYLIWSVGAAGDTAANMVFGPERKYHTEYMRALQAQKGRVKGFLFSAAGNDIIGEDPITNNASLYEILKDYNGNPDDVHGHINFFVLGKKLHLLKTAYQRVITNIRTEPGLESLPILIHGYDYVFPYPYGDDDTRNPGYAKPDEWLGEPLVKRNIRNNFLGRKIIKCMINTLYEMLDDLAGNSIKTGVWVVDCRDAMPDLKDWNDEIHGTSEGFAKVAKRFRSVLSKLM